MASSSSSATTTTTTTTTTEVELANATSTTGVTMEEEPTTTTTTPQSRIEALFPGDNARVLAIEMIDHVPLGCTVEESLHEDDDCLFVSKITKDGNAEKAGLQVGDVVVGMTGLFGALTGTMESDVEQIKRLVAAVPENDPLVVEVARGTRVLERHETALVELCNLSGQSDKDVQDCVVDFLSGGYDYDDTTDGVDAGGGDDDDNGDDETVACNDENTECMIDNMMNLWADELPLPPTTSGITDQTKERSSAKAPKPWSNRASPSGTWVRDPKTGKMRNIDP